MNDQAGNDVRRSILSTLHVLQHNKNHWHTINDLSIEMQKINNTFLNPHRRQIYRNINSLIDFGFPIVKEIGAHNEYKFKWNDANANDQREVAFVERFSQYALSHPKWDKDEMDETLPN